MSETAPGQAPQFTTENYAERTPLQEASELGLEEADVLQLGTLLASRDQPSEKRRLLQTLIERDGLQTNADGLLKTVRDYHTERIRTTEKGLPLHYHQTSLEVFKGVVTEGGLLSHNEQKRRGAELLTSGARPDVVQMTRDKHDAEGNVVARGLTGSGDNLTTGTELAIVLDDTVMELPDYDCVGKYPNLPNIPLSKAVAVVVNKAENMQGVKELLVRNGMPGMQVVLRDNWLKGYK